MKNAFTKVLGFVVIFSGWISLSSWTGGPAPECAKDSLAIVRIVKPLNEFFDIKPVMYVSRGECGIDEVLVSDNETTNSDLLLKQTLTDFLTNGYTIQTATETSEAGMQLNTYYLKKKVS